MNKPKAQEILSLLKKEYPDAKIVLNYQNKFELLVAVMLSAQTTDLQVNKVTYKVFPKYRPLNKKYANDYSKYMSNKASFDELVEIVNFTNAKVEELQEDIKSIGLYKNKARNIKSASQILLSKFKGNVPKTMDELLELPGVGRKTANVVLGNAYGIFEGIAVDTHVKRLSLKYGFTKETNPDKIEKDLMKLFQKKDWFSVTYLLIEHGRSIRRVKKDFILEQKLA